MFAANDDVRRLGLELLRIKGAINQKNHSANDLDLLSSCLTRDDDLALIAAGYALSEELSAVKATATEVLRRRLTEIEKGRSLPNSWAEMAIIEGLLCTDNNTLSSLKENATSYLKRLLVEPSRIADLNNASSLLRRLVTLDAKEASDLSKEVDLLLQRNPQI